MLERCQVTPSSILYLSPVSQILVQNGNRCCAWASALSSPPPERLLSVVWQRFNDCRWGVDWSATAIHIADTYVISTGRDWNIYCWMTIFTPPSIVNCGIPLPMAYSMVILPRGWHMLSAGCYTGNSRGRWRFMTMGLAPVSYTTGGISILHKRNTYRGSVPKEECLTTWSHYLLNTSKHCSREAWIAIVPSVTLQSLTSVLSTELMTVSGIGDVIGNHFVQNPADRWHPHFLWRQDMGHLKDC